MLLAQTWRAPVLISPRTDLERSHPDITDLESSHPDIPPSAHTLSQMPKVKAHDYKLFSYATVSTFTEELVLLGLLGDWWVLSATTGARGEFRM